MKPHILLIDDDRNLCQIIMEHLSHDLYLFDVAYSGKKGIEAAKKKRPDLIIIDFQMPEMDGLEAIGEIHKLYPNLPFIFLTAFSSVDTAVEVMKLGAIDYIQKPFHSERLKITVRNAVKTLSLTKEVENLKYIVKDHLKLDKIVGRSKEIDDLKKMIRKTFNVDSTVLILGESGTGKELVARTIHENTQIRDTSKYVAVNCASLPENLLESELFGHEKGAFTGATELKIGKFEYANGGTLFLDEICEMSFQTQAKLMRVLQEREIQRLGSNETIPVDLRIIAATNKDIEQYVRDGKFREDLYFRLNVFPIHLKPLRERVGDIEDLAM
ncbi:MAG: sigma-54-dependent Fis family transcriptional regulator, partial [Calditrichaeota bacterium]|nr:sigma-54-dependent Fis family transcriptional regulator [Calditrichota bacterium]